ncbi:hypothetical protein M885DRAFT_588803 [Pelagophyceae sp. CCMP2097]|nr:hypothetical protein M885DRAFT_588803 [Pelagophyceae sp. CCMP2097]|mmetsp:Transcript_259/g.929  ORF Transcript_259/g.929 Transcript_259/m.929 type:complete len:241 (-) Transcript_259:42-764(-)
MASDSAPVAPPVARPRWEWEDELLYALPERAASSKCFRPDCANVEAGDQKYAKCGKCGAKYCCRDCQASDWKKCHKHMCAQLQIFKGRDFDSELKREAVVRGVVGRIRMYIFPFFVHHRAQNDEPGALYIQSQSTLDEFFFDVAVNQYGDKLDRSLHVAYVTAAEFDTDLAADDFELALARAALRRALASAQETEAAALVRFRCGYVAVVVLPIFDLRICAALAPDYEGKAQLQLNVDAN